MNERVRERVSKQRERGYQCEYERVRAKCVCEYFVFADDRLLARHTLRSESACKVIRTIGPPIFSLKNLKRE